MKTRFFRLYDSTQTHKHTRLQDLSLTPDLVTISHTHTHTSDHVTILSTWPRKMIRTELSKKVETVCGHRVNKALSEFHTTMNKLYQDLSQRERHSEYRPVHTDSRC